MKPRARIYLLMLACLLPMTWTGCKQDIGNAAWDVDVLSPIVNTRLDLEKLVTDSILEASEEGALRLRWETPLIDLPLDSILKIPDTTVSNGINLPFPIEAAEPGTQLPPISDNTQYDLGDLALSEVVLRSGRLQLNVKSVIPTGIEFQYLIPVATRDGATFQTTQIIPASVDGDTSSVAFEFDLSGYRINLRGIDNSGFNTLSTIYVLKTDENGQTISIPADDTIFILEYSFLDLVPDYGRGYFGQQSIQEQEESELDVLSNITEGQLFLDSVTIGLKLTNGVGADARFRINALRSINANSGNTVDLEHQLIGSNVLLSRAIDANGTAAGVIPSERNYVLNNSNSNIRPFIENLPTRLGFDFEFDLNPLGNTSSGNDFFYFEQPFEALLDINIPLRVRADNITFVDTVDWNLGENATLDAINNGTFTLVATNAFPFGAELELELLDANMQPMGFLLETSSVPAPPLDAALRVISPLETRIAIPVPEETAEAVVNASHLRIKARLNSAAQPELVDIYTDNVLDIKLIGNFNVNIGASSL